MNSDAILGRRALAIGCAVLILIFTPQLVSCAVLETLRPQLTAAAGVLIDLLEDVLDDYESASINESATTEQKRSFAALQDARHAFLSDLIDRSQGKIPPDIVQEYRVRIERVPSLAP